MSGSSYRKGKTYEELYCNGPEIRAKISKTLRQQIDLGLRSCPKGPRPNLKGTRYICCQCGVPFDSSTILPGRSRYCSDRCRVAGGSFRVGPCEECGATVRDRKSGKRLFCNKQCYSRWQRGRVKPPSQAGRNVSSETRLRRSVSLKQAYAEGRRQAPMAGRHHTVEWFERLKPFWARLSIERQGRGNPAWKNEKVDPRYPEEWSVTLRKSIRERDGHMCQVCLTEGLVCVHHIDYNKFNCASENLISLCRKCHGRVHGGPKNREAWRSLFQELMIFRARYLQSGIHV